MKVFITGSQKKRKYEYKIITLDTSLKGWEIATRWGKEDPILDVEMDRGKIFITIRKRLINLE